MKQLKKIYQRYKKFISNILFPLLLFLYPLVKVNQGIDVSDSTYSLSNYLYFERMEGTWVISTYFSNVFGWLLTRLPYGDTLIGMNLYTGLLVSFLVIFVYQMLRKWMPDWIIFAGEFIAIGFLWIPTGILYNYLTYILFTTGALLLYKGLVEDKNRDLFFAGIALGWNVWVRIPNLAEMALIVCVWYYCYLQREKWNAMYLVSKGTGKTVAQKTVIKTGICIGGYVIGALIPLCGILMQYGISGIMEMIQGLGAIQSGDDSYSIFSMIKACVDAYVRTGKWVLFIIIGIVFGMAMFFLQRKKFVFAKKLIYLAGIVVLIRFFWGRGMFSFRYYEDYSSMYEWGMIGLYLGLIACGYLLFGKGVSKSERLWGMISLVIIMITPLGSNNYTYQNLNNLFLTAPVTLYAFVKLFRRQYTVDVQFMVFPWKAMIAALGFMILVQSVGFHLTFVFRDGMDGTPRDTVLTGPFVAAGMKTTRKNAENLSGLMIYVSMEKEHIKEAVYFGDCPGLPFLLQVPSAIDSSWPDLDSFAIVQMEQNLMELKEEPAVIIQKVEPSSDSFVEKKELLLDYMNEKNYGISYENEMYIVYQSLENEQE